MSIRIIVGGPPNSGKSTFTESLVEILHGQEVNVESAGLDLWSPTLDYLQGRITKEQRNKQKRKSVDVKDVEGVCNKFKNAAEKCDVIVGDAPGITTEETK